MKANTADASTVIVGAAGALGSAISHRLASESHSLVLVGRSREPLDDLAAQLPDSRAVLCDITSDQEVGKLAAEVGAVRMLVYVPAAPTAGGIAEAPPSAINAAVDVKVGGLLRCLRALTPMQCDGLAAAVVIGGNLAYDPIPDAATSGIANAAQANAVRQLEGVLPGQGWRIHVVAPGPVETARWDSLAEAEAQRRGVQVEVIRSEAAAASPLQRLTSTDEVAWAVSMLADPHAAALHGSTLLMDTGRRRAIP
ncbi:MAG: SDR family oxidoreductase [Candidatus Nanopelagicales bacterium]|jgi:short-subunit dehydrogenase